MYLLCNEETGHPMKKQANEETGHPLSKLALTARS
jgi:hypothetical protein